MMKRNPRLLHTHTYNPVIEKYIDLHLYNEVIGLGDTSSDYGIFKHCNFNYLVDPTQETLERLILKGCKIDKIIKK